MSDDTPVLDPAAAQRLQRMGGAKLLRQMLELYLSLGPERLAALADGAAANDATRVERAAHNLKSSSGNVGALRLMEAATLLERQAGDGVIDAELVQRVPVEFAESAARLRDLLEEMVE